MKPVTLNGLLKGKNLLLLFKRNFSVSSRSVFAIQKVKIDDGNLIAAAATGKSKLVAGKSTIHVNTNESPKCIDFTEPVDKNEELSRKRSVLDNTWSEVRVNLRELPKLYSALSKQNLTTLVVLTTVSGYIMAYQTFSPLLFVSTTIGTGLTSAAANAINQYLEVPYDSQMNRTRDRALVRGRLSPLHGFTFGVVSGITGTAILYYMVNPITAILGATNFFLYTAVYTPMKRLSILNTWMGSLVGAIPPIMGFTAVTGQIDAASLLLGAILYSWQFPHFHALSWNLRNDYTKAGYRMIAAINPRVCTSSSLNHTLGLTLMCTLLAPLCELTTWSFAIDALPFNLYFIYLAAKFKLNQDANSSRKLFRFSLIYLPVIIILLFITKLPSNEKTHAVDNYFANMKSINLEDIINI